MRAIRSDFIVLVLVVVVIIKGGSVLIGEGDFDLTILMPIRSDLYYKKERGCRSTPNLVPLFKSEEPTL